MWTMTFFDKSTVKKMFGVTHLSSYCGRPALLLFHHQGGQQYMTGRFLHGPGGTRVYTVPLCLWFSANYPLCYLAISLSLGFGVRESSRKLHTNARIESEGRKDKGLVIGLDKIFFSPSPQSDHQCEEK